MIRFGEVWQMSEAWPGSVIQRQAIMGALTPEWGSRFHRLTTKLDRHVNRRGRSFLLIEVKPMGGYLGLAGAGGISMSDQLTVPFIIRDWIRHEAGHVWDQLELLTVADRRWFQREITGDDSPRHWNLEFQETFADRFRDWINSDGDSWPALGERLLTSDGSPGERLTTPDLP